ncbi:hypothetical protein AB0A91_08840 [Streptomyces sp. NPDC042207]
MSYLVVRSLHAESTWIEWWLVRPCRRWAMNDLSGELMTVV